jgi:hypothetical protein
MNLDPANQGGVSWSLYLVNMNPAESTGERRIVPDRRDRPDHALIQIQTPQDNHTTMSKV